MKFIAKSFFQSLFAVLFTSGTCLGMDSPQSTEQKLKAEGEGEAYVQKHYRHNIGHNKDSIVLDTGKLKGTNSQEQFYYLDELCLNGQFLKNIKRLFLNHNLLNKVPHSIALMRELDTLSFAFNPITTLPSCMGSMQKLSMLNIYSHEIETLPDSLCSLPSLQNLFVAPPNARRQPPFFRRSTNKEEDIMVEGCPFVKEFVPPSLLDFAINHFAKALKSKEVTREELLRKLPAELIEKIDKHKPTTRITNLNLPIPCSHEGCEEKINAALPHPGRRVFKTKTLQPNNNDLTRNFTGWWIESYCPKHAPKQ